MNSRNDIIRQQIKTLRATIDNNLREKVSSIVANQIGNMPAFRTASKVAVYYAVRNEVDACSLQELAWYSNKNVYLPVIQPSTHLKFAPYHRHTPVYKNRYGIPEPEHSPDDLLDPADMDIVIVPLVAFSSACNRLGMGGGYYDRSLAKISDSSCITIGIAYEFQHNESFDVHDWDIGLHYVVSETAVYSNPSINRTSV